MCKPLEQFPYKDQIIACAFLYSDSILFLLWLTFPAPVTRIKHLHSCRDYMQEFPFSKQHLTVSHLWTSSLSILHLTQQYLPRYLSRNGLVTSHNPLVSVFYFCDGGECGEVTPGRQQLCLIFCDTAHGKLPRPQWAYVHCRGHSGVGRVWIIHREVVVIIQLSHIVVIVVILLGVAGVVISFWAVCQRATVCDGSGDGGGRQVHTTTAELFWGRKAKQRGRCSSFVSHL